MKIYSLWNKIQYFYWSVHYGIINIFRWIPVIWSDSFSDWCYFTKILEYKLRYDSKEFKKYGHFIGHEKVARDMLICAELLKRIREDYAMDSIKVCNRYTYKLVDKQNEYYKDYCLHLIAKHLYTWWN